MRGFLAAIGVVLLLPVSPGVFAQTAVESTTTASPSTELAYRVNGVVMMIDGAGASIRQCHALPGQVQGLDFSPQARALVDDFISSESGWDGVGDIPGFYLDGWARIDGNGGIVMQHVEAMRRFEDSVNVDEWCDATIFVGGGVEPPWTVSVTRDHISLEVGYPDEQGDRRSYQAEAQLTLLDKGAYRWQSTSPVMTVTIKPGSCSFGMRGGNVTMWKVAVLVPSDPVRQLSECGTRGGAPLPQDLMR